MFSIVAADGLLSTTAYLFPVETVKLVSEANNQLNQNPDVRVWYNHFNDLIGAGIVYNTRSNKYGEMTVLQR